MINVYRPRWAHPDTTETIALCLRCVLSHPYVQSTHEATGAQEAECFECGETFDDADRAYELYCLTEVLCDEDEGREMMAGWRDAHGLLDDLLLYAAEWDTHALEERLAALEGGKEGGQE
jgi:hypothetical protein